METIDEFEVKDISVTVAVSCDGRSVHDPGPKEWAARIGKIPVVVARRIERSGFATHNDRTPNNASA